MATLEAVGVAMPDPETRGVADEGAEEVSTTSKDPIDTTLPHLEDKEVINIPQHEQDFFFKNNC